MPKTPAYVFAVVAIALVTTIIRLFATIAPECPNTFFLTFIAGTVVAWLLRAGLGGLSHFRQRMRSKPEIA